MKSSGAAYSPSAILYHVTPAENTFAILKAGVDPAFSVGKLKAAWYVSRHNIEWALLHCSARHIVPVNDLAVCATLVQWDDMKRTNRKGVFYTFVVYTPENVSPAAFFVEGDELWAE